MDRHGLRNIILHEFKLGQTAPKAAENINKAWGEGTTSRQSVAFWFKKFQSGDLSLEDKERRGRPSVVDIAKLKREIRKNPGQSSRVYAEKLKVGTSSIKRALKRANIDKMSAR